MNMLRAVSKSLLLIVLIVISFYQIGELWFDGNSDRNSFYNVLPTSNNVASGSLVDATYVLQPSQMSIYIGSDSLQYAVIRRSANAYDNVREAATEIISNALIQNSNKGSLDDLSLLWSEQHIMIKFPIALDHEMVEKSLNLKSNTLKKIDLMDTIIIVPAKPNETYLTVYVENKKDKSYQIYELDTAAVEVEDEWLNYFIEVYSSNSSASYDSTLKNHPDRYFDNHILLPSTTNGIRYQEELILDLPFNNGEILKEKELKEYVTHFFENVSTVSSYEIEGGIYFRELEKGGVKYLLSGMVEYNKIGVKTPSYTDLATAITVATQFVEEDMEVLPAEYYLRETAEIEGQVVLYYDIGYNEFPIVMSSEVMQNYDLSKPYPITVVVSEDEVVTYKRVLRSVDEMIPQSSIIQTEYTFALDKLVETTGNINIKVSDIYLGYVWSDLDQGMKLYWVIKTTDGEIYYFEVEE